jgi:hypothetical protein
MLAMRKKITAIVIFAVIATLLTSSFIQYNDIRLNLFPYNKYPDILYGYYGAHEYSIIDGLGFSLVYTNPTIDISFDYITPVNMELISSFSYNLNGTGYTKLPSRYWSDDLVRVYHMSGCLKNLPNGKYNIMFYLEFINGTSREFYGNFFVVNPDYKEPTLRVFSPINQTTYHTNSVELTYTIDSLVYWSYYSLDSCGPGAYYKRFEGNITISNLSEGPHFINLIVQTEASRLSANHPISSQTIDFTIDTSNGP